MRFTIAALAALSLAAVASAQSDPFGGAADNVSSACRHWVAITPSDTGYLTTIPKAIYVGGAGDVTMIGVAAPAGTAGVKWAAVPASSLLPVRPRQILATGTTATLIVACY